MIIQTLTLSKPDIRDFALERNRLLEKAKANWVLFLDTDEVLSDTLKKEIVNLKPLDYSGFYIKRKIYFLGKLIGGDKVLRLGRKNAGKWRRAVHETWEIKGRIGTMENYIVHNTATNLHDYIGKMNKYAYIHAAENLKEGKRSNIFKIIFYPKFKFLQNILSGHGFVFGMLQSFHSFLAWSELWILQKD